MNKEYLSSRLTEDDMEAIRETARSKHRILYDCWNARVKPDEPDKVYCAKGHSLGGRHGPLVSLNSTLRGRTPGICKQCPDFDGGDDDH